MSGQKRANRSRQQTEQLAQHFWGSACRSVNYFCDGQRLLGAPGGTAGCLPCRGKAAAWGCDFQQLLTKLFLTKGPLELQPTLSRERSLAPLQQVRGEAGQPRAQCPEEWFLQKNPAEIPAAEGGVHRPGGGGGAPQSASPASTQAATPAGGRLGARCRGRPHLCRPLPEARAGAGWALCRQKPCAGDHYIAERRSSAEGRAG